MQICRVPGVGPAPGRGGGRGGGTTRSLVSKRGDLQFLELALGVGTRLWYESMEICRVSVVGIALGETGSMVTT